MPPERWGPSWGLRILGGIQAICYLSLGCVLMWFFFPHVLLVPAAAVFAAASLAVLVLPFRVVLDPGRGEVAITVAFWTRHPQSKAPLTAWYHAVDKVEWKTPVELMNQFGANVDFVGDNRAIFDIAGNKYRIVVWINYPYRVVYIRFIGTHRQYDAIDAQTI